ncbi:hypothetical protein NDU88_010770 [Pleurodeles waltl]|uniref:Uncharacterized protein n=1 Tax=Pleurodeles waltl TaxID=8319 RepID=A0AAV7QY95_PLEWA|nr:hypothetical protein NDU88_010770 [Pleurodeles waltl]
MGRRSVLGGEPRARARLVLSRSRGSLINALIRRGPLKGSGAQSPWPPEPAGATRRHEWESLITRNHLWRRG